MHARPRGACAVWSCQSCVCEFEVCRVPRFARVYCPRLRSLFDATASPHGAECLSHAREKLRGLVTMQRLGSSSSFSVKPRAFSCLYPSMRYYCMRTARALLKSLVVVVSSCPIIITVPW